MAAEVNPLIASPIAFAGLMVARLVGVELADRMPEPERTQLLSAMNSVWWGVCVSNVLIALTAATPVGLATGAMAGLVWWQSTDLQRQFAEICASEKQANPRLTCEFKT